MRMTAQDAWKPVLNVRRDKRVTLNLTPCGSEGHASADSRIRDADIATTAADLRRTQMLQQGGLAARTHSQRQPSQPLPVAAPLAEISPPKQASQLGQISRTDRAALPARARRGREQLLFRRDPK